jgi:hypothetical protein
VMIIVVLAVTIGASLHHERRVEANKRALTEPGR